MLFLPSCQLVAKRSGLLLRPAKATGDDSCPLTMLYWDFLMRHEKFLSKTHCMSMQLKKLTRLDPLQCKAIQQRAAHVRGACCSPASAI